MCADGLQLTAERVFRGVCKPSLSNGVSSQPVELLILVGWTLYWCYEVSSVEKTIFNNWITTFVLRVQERAFSEKMTVLFYDAAQLQMESAVFKKLADRNIAVVEFPAHTSHRLQDLDVIVFSLLKLYVARSYSAKLV